MTDGSKGEKTENGQDNDCRTQFFEANPNNFFLEDTLAEGSVGVTLSGEVMKRAERETNLEQIGTSRKHD